MEQTAMRTIEIPTAIGAPFAGGFYFGRFFLAAQAYALVVSPKAEGEHNKTQWHDDETDVAGANSYFDGLANTDAMVAAGSKLGKWARDLRIGAHDDWYLPSRAELLQINGLEDATAAFKAGDAEAFERNWYWSSTQRASVPSYAWCQGFSHGGILYFWKTGNGIRARAVRRVLIQS